MVFKERSSKGTSVNFQILSCDVPVDDGEVLMHAGAFFFFAEALPTRFLWHDYSSTDISLYKGVRISALDMTVYSMVREMIKDKLCAVNAERFIGDLRI